MQTITAPTSDNHDDPVLTCPTEQPESPIMGNSGLTEAANVDEVGSAAHRTPGFQSGNQLWRRRRSPEARKNREALREALHKALTPDKMAKAVRKMLVIINGDDKKAAVQAFKVLTEVAGVRHEPDNTRSGPVFTFILPSPGAIPTALPAPVDGTARPIED